jgi:glycosyltransferase involved in cell wall biosynthesis
VSGSPQLLRIAVVARAAYPLHGLGGLERHVWDLVRHHLGTGHEVTLITRTPDPSTLDGEEWRELAAEPRFTAHFVPYTTFPLAGRRGTTVIDRSTAYPIFGWRAGRVAERLARNGAVDVVYGLGAAVFGYRRAAAGVPLVFNPQGLEEFGGADEGYGGRRLKRVGYEPLRRAVRACARRSDAVIATDRALLPVVERQLGVGPARIHVVPNGIDVDWCDRLAGPEDGRRKRERAGIVRSDVLLLSVGRLQRNKGFHLLAEALGAWRNRPGWRWAIAGDGPYRSDVESACAAAGIAERVRWLGAPDTPALHAWYEAADVFVHPTQYEGSSLVTLEAMAHRRPVLATTAGGLPDKVIPGNTGWLVAPSSAPALAEGLESALNQRDEWTTMGTAGRLLAREQFSWSVVGAQLLDVYVQVRASAQAGSP